MATPLSSMAAVFQALGDETRLRILGLLRAGEVCVCHIHESLEIPQSKASRHLAYLRKAGLVEARKEGLWVYYRLAAPAGPVEARLREAVLHALGHAAAPRRDAVRLQRKTGCCPPADGARPDLACCTPS